MLNMNRKKKLSLIFILLFLAGTYLFFNNFFLQPEAENKATSVINSPINIINDVYFINKSLLINNTFFVINSTLIFSSSAREALFLETTRFANILIINSTLKTNDNETRYYLKIGRNAKFQMINSTIIGMGYRFSYTGEGHGLWLNTADAIIKNSTFLYDYNGILLFKCKNVSIENNMFIGGLFGVYSWFSENISIRNNLFYANVFYGFTSFGSINQSIARNNFIGTGIYFSGKTIDIFINNSFELNFINGKPLVYLLNQSEVLIENISVGQIILAFCKNITIKNISVLVTQISHSKNIIIENITTEPSVHGIYVEYSDNITILSSNITLNLYGIVTDLSNNIKIKNVIFVNNLDGAYFLSTDNILVKNSIFKNNSGNAIFGSGCDNLTLESNIIEKNNGTAIFLKRIKIGRIYGNLIKSNEVGLTLILSQEVTIINNSFINNNIQAQTDKNIFWSANVIFGMNNWSDYGGFDLNSDGFGDIPYFISNFQFDFNPICSPGFVGWWLIGIIAIIIVPNLIWLIYKYKRKKIRGNADG